MADHAKIRIAIVDDNAEQRRSLTLLLGFEEDIEVIGEASTGEQGIAMVKAAMPNIVLMDINLPDMDGIKVTEAISREAPGVDVVMMSIQGEPDYLRRSMLAGARNFLIKPFTSDELTSVIRQVHAVQTTRQPMARAVQQAMEEQQAHSDTPQGAGQIFAVYSPKGGVGCTSVATNLAIAIKMTTGKRVALVDASLLFGDVGVMLNLPEGKSMHDLVRVADQLDERVLNGVMVQHSSGVSVLLAPPKPELAEQITGDVMRQILEALVIVFDYVIVDTYASFGDTMLTVLDAADRILLVMTLEMPVIKNVRIFLDVANALRYPGEKILLVVNRSDRNQTLKSEDVEASVKHRVDFHIAGNGVLVTLSINQGVPYVVHSRDAPVAKSIFAIAEKLTRTGEETSDQEALELAKPAAKSSGRLGRFLRRG